MKKSFFTKALLFFPLTLLLLGPPLHPGENLHAIWAIKDCKVITMTGKDLVQGTVIIKNGLIHQVGANLKIPANAEVIDGKNLTLYPGFIDGLNQSLLKLPTQKFDMTKIYTGKYNDQDRGYTPEFKSFDYVKLTSAVLKKYHQWGISAAHILPRKGIFTGQSAFLSLSSVLKNTALIHKEQSLGITFNPSSYGYPGSLMGVVAFLKQTLADALYYNTHRQLWKKYKNGVIRPEYDPKMEIIKDLVTGRKSAIFLCNNHHDIKRALKLGQEFKLDYFICDLGSEAFRVIKELQRAKARVLCTLSFKPPETNLYSQLGREQLKKAEKELYARNITKISEAGIPFVFSSLGTDDPKSFSEGILKAIENGLSPPKALKALTIDAARFLGLEKGLGTIEQGKIANLFLLDGKLFSKDAKVKYLFADGRKFDLQKKAGKGEKPTVNVSGKWEFTIQGMKLSFDFIQEGASLSGRLGSPFGVFEFTDGIVSGNQISFDLSISVGGQSIDLYFSAEVTGDKMEGTVVQGTQGAAEFVAKRVPAGGEK